MRYIHKLFFSCIICVLFFIFSGIQQVFADYYIDQINETSSETDVKRLQNIFSELDLYSGKIDGDFESIRDELVEYQVDEGVISDKNHDHAGYFGKKTIQSLKEKFGENFEKLQDKFLKIETVSPENYTNGQKIVFEATAYYSPVLGQKEYYRGNYDAEVALQGDGKMTASGTAPHAGTLALPKNYDFGTKIYIEGYGVGVVEDRGGAIRGNKIDIWMGRGDSGRKRALKFGRRKVVGYIVAKNQKVDFSLNGNYKKNNTNIENEEKINQKETKKQVQIKPKEQVKKEDNKQEKIEKKQKDTKKMKKKRKNKKNKKLKGNKNTQKELKIENKTEKTVKKNIPVQRQEDTVLSTEKKQLVEQVTKKIQKILKESSKNEIEY
ncbi:hypothetical protein KGV52_01110 [Candidatus Gracilibacteria bacterium]|nr:hypothetical protein [Candidatus Gracilibacteria bacterium]